MPIDEMFAFCVLLCASLALALDIRLDDVKFTIFDGSSNSFESKVYESLQTTETFFADKDVEKINSVAMTALGFVPVIGQLADILATTTSLMAEESEWKEAFARTIGREMKSEIVLDRIVWMESAMKTIQNKMKVLNVTNSDQQSRKNFASYVHTSLDMMVNYFVHPSSLFKKFPLIAAPALIELALLIVTFNPIAYALLDTEATDPQLACKIRDALMDYRQRAVEERLHKISTTEEPYEYVYRAYMAHLRTLPNNPTGLIHWRKGLRCNKDCQTEICIQDEFGSDKYSEMYDNSTECMQNYAVLVRKRTEELFPVDLLSKACDKEPLQPTGSGYLTIKIRNIRAWGIDTGDACDESLNVQCDSFIKLFVNDEQVQQTGIRSNLCCYDADLTYTTKRIPKSSKIKIEVWDDDSWSKHDLIQEAEGDIESFLKEPMRTGATVPFQTFETRNTIETAMFWMDETLY